MDWSRVFHMALDAIYWLWSQERHAPPALPPAPRPPAGWGGGGEVGLPLRGSEAVGTSGADPGLARGARRFSVPDISGPTALAQEVLPARPLDVAEVPRDGTEAYFRS